jgi:hypothetical protein
MFDPKNVVRDWDSTNIPGMRYRNALKMIGYYRAP